MALAQSRFTSINGSRNRSRTPPTINFMTGMDSSWKNSRMLQKYPQNSAFAIDSIAVLTVSIVSCPTLPSRRGQPSEENSFEGFVSFGLNTNTTPHDETNLLAHTKKSSASTSQPRARGRRRAQSTWREGWRRRGVRGRIRRV